MKVDLFYTALTFSMYFNQFVVYFIYEDFRTLLYLLLQILSFAPSQDFGAW